MMVKNIEGNIKVMSIEETIDEDIERKQSGMEM